MNFVRLGSAFNMHAVTLTPVQFRTWLQPSTYSIAQAYAVPPLITLLWRFFQSRVGLSITLYQLHLQSLCSLLPSPRLPNVISNMFTPFRTSSVLAASCFAHAIPDTLLGTPAGWGWGGGGGGGPLNAFPPLSMP